MSAQIWRKTACNLCYINCGIEVLIEDGRIVANGGRVLNVSALGMTVADAQARAYAAVDRIRWPEGFCNHDIGWRAVGREQHT